MNHMTLMGHLGADPEVRSTPSGQKVTTLRVAANQRRGGKEETTWWKVTIWGDHLDKMLSFFKKGSSIIAYGEMSKPEIYTDKSGQPQVSLNLTASSLGFNPFGRSDKSEGGGQYQGAGASTGAQTSGGAFAAGGAQQQSYGGNTGSSGAAPQAGNNPFSSFGDSDGDQIPF
ncbi:single-stranded DNA-binding protein [Candidatus Aerophobetes bacterium]|uniref:Single-stranded DNA-binding protein n=1 Tax=Aerophobetes bacterium TaxID=2030807 RepID=A0A2A4X6L9_UNCAE|nr:MAG: single-stranded DNA-binding protein [Candidatus Aerophobetes bacterium]